MFDYRKLEERNKGLQAKVDELLAKDNPTHDDKTQIAELMGAIHANDAAAAEIREAELEHLREQIKNSQPVAGEVKDDPAEAQRKAFFNYLRTGKTDPMLIQDASMSTTDANGGYIVPEPAHGPFVEKARAYNPIMRNATMFELTGDASMVLPYKATHGAATTAAEAGARSEQNAPTAGAASLTCYDYYSDQRATQQFLDSVTVNGQPGDAWLAQSVYDDIFEKAELDCVTGNGSTAITGLFSTAAQSFYTTSTSGSADTLVNTAFLKWFFALHPKYRANAKWVMNSASLATVAGYVWPNTYDKLCEVGNDGVVRILGKEVLETQNAPTIGNGAFPVAFGDIAQGYAVGVHRAIGILRDPYTATPKIRFYGVGRIGGVPWDPAAILLGKSDDS